LKHATGEAIFTDDIVPASNELRGVFLFSNRAHAKILRIDASAALDIPGVVALLTEKDLPGPNVAGLVSLRDEPIFAPDEVHACGQFVGLMLAETHQLAKDACKLVHIEYEDLPAILTIEAAIRQKSFFSGSDRALSFGDTEVGFSESDVVVEGSINVIDSDINAWLG
jgi:xanthine dehydrogenase/oxidase